MAEQYNNDNEVKVIITADASSLKQELNKALKELSDFSNQASGSIDIKATASGLNATTKEIKKSVSSGLQDGFSDTNTTKDFSKEIRKSVSDGVSVGLSEGVDKGAKSFSVDFSDLSDAIDKALEAGLEGGLGDVNKELSKALSQYNMFDDNKMKSNFDIESDLFDLKETIADTKSQLSELKDELKEAEKLKSEIESKLAETTAKLNEPGSKGGAFVELTAKDYEDYKVKLDEASKSVEELKNKLLELKDALKETTLKLNDSKRQLEYKKDVESKLGIDLTGRNRLEADAAARAAYEADIKTGNSSSTQKAFLKAFTTKGLSDTPLAGYGRVISAMVEGASKLGKSIGEIAIKIAAILVVVKIIATIVKQFISSAKQVAKVGKEAAIAFGKLTVNVAKAFAAIGSFSFDTIIFSLKKIISLSKQMMSIFSISYKSGIDRIYEWSKLNNTQLAPSLDKITSSCHALENALAAMAAPILETLAPIIDKLTDKVLVLANGISKLFALMTGKSSYAKVIKTTTEYSKATDKAATSLKKFLLGFDELNLVPDNDTNDLEEAANSFIEVSEDLDKLTPFQIGANFGKDLLDWMTSIDWSSIKQKARNMGAKLANILNGIFSVPNLGAEFGKMLAEAVNTAFEFLGRFFATFDGKKFGQQLSDIVKNFFTTLDYDMIHQACQDAVDDIVDTINTFLQDKERAAAVADGISTLISNAVKDVCDLINGIDWETLVTNLCETLRQTIEKLPAEDIAQAIMTVVNTAFTILEEIPLPEIAGFAMNIINSLLEELPKTLKEHSGAEIGQNISDALNVIIDEMDPEKISGAVNAFVDWVTEFWHAIKEKVDWQELGQKIGEAIAEIDWVEALKIAFEIISDVWTFKNMFKKTVFEEICNDIHDEWMRIIDEKIGKFSEIGAKIGKAIVSGIEGALRTLNLAGVISDINEYARSDNKQETARKKLNFYTGGLFWNKYATGGVVTEPTPAIVGEYAGASTNPEIITPENKMREVFNEGNSQLASVYLLVGRLIIAAIENQDFNVQIGDDQIGYAAARANNNYYRRTGKALI